MLAILELMAGFQDFKSQISDLKLQVENISRQLRAWLDRLQNSDIKGPRHLTDASREEYARKIEVDAAARDRKEFMEEIRRMVSDSRGF